MDESREWIFISSGQGHAKLPRAPKSQGAVRRQAPLILFLVKPVQGAAYFWSRLPLARTGETISPVFFIGRKALSTACGQDP